MKIFTASLPSKNGIVILPVDVYGCTDPLATNYNPLATINDGSCVYLNIGYFTLPATLPITFN